LLLIALPPQVRQCEIHSDPVCPGPEISLRIESRSGAENPPECFQGEVLGGSGITHDAHDRGIDFALKLPEKGFEDVKIALRESFQQAHCVSILLYPDFAMPVPFLSKSKDHHGGAKTRSLHGENQRKGKSKNNPTTRPTEQDGEQLKLGLIVGERNLS